MKKQIAHKFLPNFAGKKTQKKSITRWAKKQNLLPNSEENIQKQNWH